MLARLRLWREPADSIGDQDLYPRKRSIAALQQPDLQRHALEHHAATHLCCPGTNRASYCGRSGSPFAVVDEHTPSHGRDDARRARELLSLRRLLTRPISALAGSYGQVQLARGALARLNSVLNERPEPMLDGAPDLPPIHGEIVFDKVGFAYPERSGALREVSLHIRAGETIALTGENGAGKSTLVHLLFRLHKPDRGKIFVDGVDIATVSLQKSAPTDRHRPPARPTLQWQCPRQHRFRKDGRHMPRDRASRAPRPGSRIHCRSAAGL